MQGIKKINMSRILAGCIVVIFQPHFPIWRSSLKAYLKNLIVKVITVVKNIGLYSGVSFNICVTLGKSLKLLKSRFPHQYN